MDLEVVRWVHGIDWAGQDGDRWWALVNLVMNLLVHRPGYLSRYSDSLRAGRSGDRIPVGMRFSATVRTGPGVHLASYTMGTGSFPGVKRLGRGAALPHLVQRLKTVELYIVSHSGPSWCVLGWILAVLQITYNLFTLVLIACDVWITKKKKTKLRGLSPHANYTDRAGRRS